MKRQTGWIGGGLLTAAIGMAFAQAQAPAPLLRQTFEMDEGGWTTIGQNGKVSLTHEAANVKEGKAALKFDYTIKKGEMSLLVLPIMDGKLSKMQSLSFWVKSNHAAPLVLVLSEKDGGRYNASFSAPKDKWQRVELAPSDFTLGIGKDDPKDPDGKLDLDKIENIGLVDFGQFFAQTDDPNLAKLFHIQMGDQTLFLDDFTVSETKLPDPAPTDKEEYRLDTFARPQLERVMNFRPIP